MSWIFLVLAIVLEVAGTTCMKLSQGFTQIKPTIFMAVFYALSLGALTLALKSIDVSVAYAIWAGIGTALIALIGMTIFREPASPVKFVCIALIIAGVVGLHLGGAHAAPSPSTSTEVSPS